MLAGLFEPFVFPSQLLWLGRKVDTCLGPWGSQYCAVNWAQKLASCPLRTGDREGGKLELRLSVHKHFAGVEYEREKKQYTTLNKSDVATISFQLKPAIIINHCITKISWQLHTFRLLF